MRTVELAKVATAAEALRLRRIARRQAFRVAYAAAAAVFGVAVLVALHVLIATVLMIWLSPWLAVLILMVLDLAAAGACGYFALVSPPDAVEQEARQVRAAALTELRRSLTVMGMAAEVVGMAFRSGPRGAGARGAPRRGLALVAAELASRLIGR